MGVRVRQIQKESERERDGERERDLGGCLRKDKGEEKRFPPPLVNFCGVGGDCEAVGRRGLNC